MYIIYESYPDNFRNDNNLQYNTSILCVCENLEDANKELDYLLNLKCYRSEVIDWFFAPVHNSDNDNIIQIYELFKDEIGNYDNYYHLILEKVNIKGGIN